MAEGSGPGAAPGLDFDHIPDDILAQVVDQLVGGDAGLRDLARLSRTGRRLRRLCRVPYLIQKLSYAPDLLPPFVSDTHLPGAIRELARLMQTEPRAHRYAASWTPQAATGLYDQLGRAAALAVPVKAELTRLLVCDVAPDAFAGVVLAPDFDRAPIEAVLQLPERIRVAAVPPEIPAWMLEAVREFLRTDAARFADPKGYAADVVDAVRRRYPPPFDRIFPHTFAMSEHLSWQLAERRQPVTDAALVRALQRVGLRFGLLDFAHNVQYDAGLVPDLVPLLSCPYPPTMFGLVEMLVTGDRVSHVAALFRMRRFRLQVRADPCTFVSHVACLLYVRTDCMDFWHLFVETPEIAESVVNVAASDRYGHRTLLQLACLVQKYEVARLLLTVRTTDLFAVSGHAGLALDTLLIRSSDEYLLNSPELGAKLLADVPRFVAYLEPLFEIESDEFFQMLSRSPWFPQLPPDALADLVTLADQYGRPEIGAAFTRAKRQSSHRSPGASKADPGRVLTW